MVVVDRVDDCWSLGSDLVWTGCPEGEREGWRLACLTCSWVEDV